jgi:hypothetical protein
MDNAHDGVVEISFCRNMVNYLRREGYKIDVFEEKFMEFINRYYGSARKYRQAFGRG